MRNPMVFWGIMALLQCLWLFIGWSFFCYLKWMFPRLKRAIWMVLATVIIGNLLMVTFNHWLPSLRWRGTMGLLLFTSYAFMFTCIWTLVYQISQRFLSKKTMQKAILFGMPIGWILVVTAGLYGAYVPTTVYQQIHIDKPMAKPIKIALVADTHLGRFVGHHHLKALNEVLKKEQADVLLIAGDVVDDLPDEYRTLNMHSSMQELSAPLGKYVVLGNHDNYRQVQSDIVSDLQAAGFTVLRDQHIQLNNELVLVGRRDKVETRLSAQEVVPQSTLPVVVMDHQPEPDQMVALAKADADLIVAGHTHGGQIFPMTALIDFFQTYSYGHYHIGKGQLFVTSGLGLWGLPFRLGTRSEVVIIELHSKYSAAN